MKNRVFLRFGEEKTVVSATVAPGTIAFRDAMQQGVWTMSSGCAVPLKPAPAWRKNDRLIGAASFPQKLLITAFPSSLKYPHFVAFLMMLPLEI